MASSLSPTSNFIFLQILPWICFCTVKECSFYVQNEGVETLNQLPDILTYFHYSCPAPHILCIQFSFNLPDIH